VHCLHALGAVNRAGVNVLMRLLAFLAIAASACTSPSLWPPAAPWAAVGDVGLADGRHVHLGGPALRPADTAYYQEIWYLGPGPQYLDSEQVLVYTPADSGFMTRTEARLEGDTLVAAMAFSFGRTITLDSVIQRFTPLLGTPHRTGGDRNNYSPSAEWQRSGFRLTVTEHTGKGVTGYLMPYRPLGKQPSPDTEQRARGCFEVSYLFCPVRRGTLF